MLQMDKPIIVFDLETDSTDPEVANPIQIAGIAIDSTRLQIIPNSEFYAWCKPDNLEVPDETCSHYYETHKSTIDFHLKNYKMTKEDFFTKLKGCPSEKQVFDNFVEYIKKYHTKESSQTIFSAPKMAGYNVFSFDFPILDRLCKKYGMVDKNDKQKLYFTRDTIDIMKMVIEWLEPKRVLKAYNMDVVREYFKFPKGQSHDALFDVQQEAELLIKFLKLFKKISSQIVFEGSCAKKD